MTVKTLGRCIEFLASWRRLRSLSLALWVDQYDNHQPKF